MNLLSRLYWFAVWNGGHCLLAAGMIVLCGLIVWRNVSLGLFTHELALLAALGAILLLLSALAYLFEVWATHTEAQVQGQTVSRPISQTTLVLFAAGAWCSGWALALS